ncbi:MAG: hypothetical protein C0607_22355 [Azoarcus sp.]|nr:MAG: hypothetical protein C0607_22355 [Azoarcus sp.]
MHPKRRQDPDLLNYPHTRTDPSLRPRFCLHRSNGELYFVNHADETLDWVVNGSAGALANDGGGAAVVVTDELQCRYDCVGPGEGVLIDTFDDELDCNLYIALSVTIASPSLGVISFDCVRKGGPVSLVLLWQDGFVSPQVRMTRQTPNEDASWMQ